MTLIEALSVVDTAVLGELRIRHSCSVFANHLHPVHIQQDQDHTHIVVLVAGQVKFAVAAAAAEKHDFGRNHVVIA